MVQHQLRKVRGMDGCLNAQVAEHGVRFPTPEELDGVLVDGGAEKGCSAARTKAARREESRVDVEVVVEVPGTVA